MGLKNYFKSSKPSIDQGIPPTEKEELAVPGTESPPKYPGWGSYANGSSRASIAPSVEGGSLVDGIKQEVLVNYLFQQQCTSRWIGDGAGDREGVLVRKSKNEFLTCPPDLRESVFGRSCMALNLPCAMTINSRVIKTFLAWSPNAVDVPLKNGLRVQVLASMEDLSRARKLQFAAFIAQDGLLVVWDDVPSNLFQRAQAIEEDLLDLVWNAGMAIGEEEEKPKDWQDSDEKKIPRVTAVVVDEETGLYAPEERPTHLMNTILVAITL